MELKSPDSCVGGDLENGGRLDVIRHNDRSQFYLEIKRQPAPGKAVDQPWPINLTRVEAETLRHALDVLLISDIQ